MLSLRSNLGVAALATLAALTSPVHPTFADPPVNQVNVVNPATNPVPTTVVNPANMPALTSGVNDAGRQPYQKRINTNGGCVGLTLCDIVFPAVPQGYRLVVQNVSGQGFYNGSPVQVVPAIFDAENPFQAAPVFP